MNKVKAFTVLELLMNMVIISIVISVVYYAYLTFSKQVIFFQKEKEQISYFNQLDILMREDVYNSKSLERNGDKLEIYMGAYKIIYHVDDAVLSREQEGLKTTFETTSIVSYDFDSIDNMKNKWFSIDYKLLGDTIHCVYGKSYGNANAINNKFLTDEL